MLSVHMPMQIGAFGDPGRDPRGWCVSVAYAALVPSSLDIEAAVRSMFCARIAACKASCGRVSMAMCQRKTLLNVVTLLRLHVAISE